MKYHSVGSLIWLRMIRFVQRSNQLSNEYLAQYQLTVSQFEVLNQINAHEPITQTALAEQLTMSCGGISRMLTRLEKEQLITRRQDWKIKYISLTEKGHCKLNDVFMGQLALQSSMFEDVLSKDEQKQMQHLMRKLQKHSMEKQLNKD